MIRFLIKAISRSLGFSKSESKGTLALILIMFAALLLANYRISHLKNSTQIVSDTTDLKWIQEVQASIKLKKNKIVIDEIVDANVEEIKKKPTEKSSSKNKISTSTYKRNKLHIIRKDLNSASVNDLQEVRGIGKVFSDRIVKYRSMLGGFNDSTQLKEVYGLPEATIHEMFNYFSIQSPVKPVALNTDSLQVLASHPYISYDLARVIINYRKQHGDIKTPEDLKKIKALDERTFSRLRPYLK